MYKRLVVFFIVFLGCLIYPMKIYGQEGQIILLISSEGSWDQWIHSSFISSLIPKSAIGSMSNRTNHRDKEIEFYGTINAGRRWSYYEVNDMGAVEKGLGDLLNQSHFSTAFFSYNPKLKKIIENSSGNTTYGADHFSQLYSESNKDILEKADVILIEMDLYNTKENQQFLIDYLEQNPVQLYLFCPYDFNSNSGLTPFLFYDSKNSRHGLVSANTTRLKGVITNLDIAPTILRQLGIEQDGMFGEEIQIHPDQNAFNSMIEKLSKINYLNVLRSPIIKYYVILLIGLLLLFGIMNKINNLIMKKIYHAILLGVLWVPIIFMMNFSNPYISIFMMCIVFLGIIWMNILASSYEKALKATAGSILFILVLDILFGSFLQRNSFLGYDPIVGARFYGVGNEYAGIIIGSLYLFLYSFHGSRHFKMISFALHLLVILLLSMSFWGANVGGTISVLVGITMFFLHYYDYKKGKKVLCFLFLGLFLFGVLWILVDSFFVREQSHFGQTLLQFTNGNFHIFIEVLQRKVMMNLQLIKYSMWSKFLLVTLILLGIYFEIDHPILRKVGPLFMGAMTGAILFNDSGIVMSGTCMIYLVFPYLYVYNHDIRVIK